MGTAFKVYFPQHLSESEAQRELRESGSYRVSGQGHLLVVEDDGSVRAAVVRALRSAGYTVTEARNAEEALRVLDSGEKVELMITDMVMPGMPGVTLLGEARSRRPGLPAIVLSGYSGESASDMWRVPDHAVFVEKPVSPAELIRRVGQLLIARA
jgi:two-component system cell cycle sensor histidine kinase/response regulator CckA